MVERRAGAVLAAQSLVPGDLSVAVPDSDLARADARRDLQTGEHSRD